MEFYASLHPASSYVSNRDSTTAARARFPSPPLHSNRKLDPYGRVDAAPTGETGLEEGLLQMTVQSPVGMDASPGPYPERPGQPDCVYYLRNGTCGYGANCRFNHPTLEKQHGTTPGHDKEEFPERPGQPECQYFMKTGTCKFGSTCKYNHPQQKAASFDGQMQLNFLGLPLRPGEKDCTYYLRTGSCKFGVTCKFHHPQPAAVGAVVPLHGAPLYSTGAPAAPAPAPYQAGVPSWPIPSSSYMPATSGLFGPSSYMPVLVSPQSLPMSGWNSYQGSVCQMPSPDSRQQALTRGFNFGNSQHQIETSASGMQEFGGSLASSSTPTVPSSVLQETAFPERPGQPDCQHFMKTGDCKFGANCRYHHPKDRVASSMPASLSVIGLPLRPNQPPCTFYLKNGICKFGPTCKFHHPVGLSHNPSTSSLSDVPVVPYPSGSSPTTVASTSSERSHESSKVEELILLMPDKAKSPSTANGDAGQTVAAGVLQDNRNGVAESIKA